jgi:site-specific DNA recombinase
MGETKRVACLYRVSTKMQLDGDNIPLQENACKDFIVGMDGWELVREYYEKGVSGFKKKSDERDVLLEVQKDVIKKRFDILLVFMFDRLGRRDDETPFIVEWFVANGIEVWSVKEGQQRFDSHTDKLINYIRYWQASGESIKTSIRVDTKHKQMTKNGEFRGGIAPYGYRLIKSGKENKRGMELKKMVIDDKEAEAVRSIYDLSLNHGMGGQRISQYLNAHGIPSRRNCQWSLCCVNFMLRNPIYKGFFTYGKTTSKGRKQSRTNPKEWLLSDKRNDELAIVSEQMWNKVQLLRKMRTPDKYRGEITAYRNCPPNTKSVLLLTGIIRCGFCGSKMSTGYSISKWVTKDGSLHSRSKSVYKCIGKTSGKLGCEGPYTHSQDKIEGPVLEEVFRYLDASETPNLYNKIAEVCRKKFNDMELNTRKTLKSLSECDMELEALKMEIAKSIMGKSAFNPELLNCAISNKNQEIEICNKELNELSIALCSTKIAFEERLSIKKMMIPVWRDEFRKIPKEVKKMLLSQILDEVIVFRDKIDIKLKMNIEDFSDMK